VSGVRAWQRLAAEFVIIVVGVLAALAVDDWQAGVERRAAAERVIGTMEVDLTESVADLREAIASARVRQSALVEILRRLGEPLPPADEWIPWSDAPFDSLSGPSVTMFDGPSEAALFSAPAWVQVFDPRTAAFDELRSTGGLAALRDQTVRDRIVRLYAEMIDFAESNQFMRSDQAALQNAWEAAGVVPGDWLPPDETLRRLGADPRAVASIRRSYLRALDQVRSYSVVADAFERDGRDVVAAARTAF
jgi:type II secretory pathway pseudopilin PulG